MAEKEIILKDAHIDNEANANRYMSRVNAVAAIFAVVLLVMYLTKIFTIPDYFLPVVYILFSVSAVVLAIPFFFSYDLIRS